MNIDNGYAKPPADKLLGGAYDPLPMFPLTPPPRPLPPRDPDASRHETSGGVQRRSGDESGAFDSSAIVAS